MPGESLAFLKIITENKYAEHISYNTGSIVFDKDELPKGIIYIEAGKLLLKSDSANLTDEIIISEGNILGIDLLLNDLRYGFSAVAIDDVSTIFLPGTEFKKLIKDSHNNRMLVMKILCSCINLAEEKLKNIIK